VNIKTSTGGKAKICVTDELNAKATSNRYISYKCQPKQKSIDVQSGGTIEEYSE
jgi:membrane-bound inhibitor of C-type lysozyme